MQPFPTAFWKKDNATNLEDSCIQFEGRKEDADGNAIIEEVTEEEIARDITPSTPSVAKGSAGALGLYKDKVGITNDGVREVKMDYAGLNGSFLTQDNSFLGTKHAFINWENSAPESSSDYVDDFHKDKYHFPYIATNKDTHHEGEKFHLTNSPVYNEKPGWIDKTNDTYGLTQVVFHHDENNPYDNVMSKHWLDTWMGSANGLHKTNPVTMKSDCDDKKATVKCYFEKDIWQVFSEIEVNEYGSPPATQLTRFLGLTYDLYEVENILRSILKGYNGFYSNTWWDPHFFFRQRAKVRAKFTLGSEKTVRIKIKGLGADDNLGWNLDINPFTSILKNPASNYGEAEYDENGNEKTLDDLPDHVGLAPASHSFSAFSPGGGGDLQTCTIFIDNEEKIKCTAPQIGYFVDAFNIDASANYYKAPVRILELKEKGKNKNNETFHTYGRTGLSGTRGTDYHQFAGLEYIPKTKFTDGKFVRSNDDDPEVCPYGTDWDSKSDTDWYDYNSNMVTPDYASPYEFSKDYTLSAGEHNIDMLFDSVANYMNGGAYYEINIEIIDS